MPTKAELKQKDKHIKLKIRKGDVVMIIAGKDKGQIGYVAKVDPEKQKVTVLQPNEENPEFPLPLNVAVKHRKARMQNEKSMRVRKPMPLHISNVMLFDTTTQQVTRVGRRAEDGKIVRYAKKTGQVLQENTIAGKK
jgi:large subunit ribosomal protein L24